MPFLQIQTQGVPVGITPSFSSSECVILCLLLPGDLILRLLTHQRKKRERRMKNQRPPVIRQPYFIPLRQGHGWWCLSCSFMTLTVTLTRDKVTSFMCFSTHWPVLKIFHAHGAEYIKPWNSVPQWVWSLKVLRCWSLSCVPLFVTPWTAARQASLSLPIFWSLLEPDWKLILTWISLYCSAWAAVNKGPWSRWLEQ